MQCGSFLPAPVSRRGLLQQSAAGFGALAVAAMLQDEGRAAGSAPRTSDPFAPRATHHRPTARNVIFLYMDGGPSHVDTFDPKPLLEKENGNAIKLKVQPTQFDNVGKVLKSPWKFTRHGECGTPVSELFPHVARHVDRMCVVRSMTSAFSEHTNANYFLHTGYGLQGRPSMGSWVTYGLGTECRDLPGYVVLHGGLTPPGGAACFHNGFLPATYQGSIFKGGTEPVADIKPPEARPEIQQRKLALLQKLDRGLLDRLDHPEEMESAIRNYELAFRMQAAVPQLADVDSESKATQQRYGMMEEFGPTKSFGRQCLLARRLVERGVRFVQLTCPNAGGDRWDQHSGLKQGHENNARAVDQPIGALLGDLHERGLLDETLVLWAGEFGRTPMAQGSNGRDHNPFGFTVWMAGGGIRGGMTYGATDEYGYHAIENKLEMHDLHATILHALGIDHTQLTVRFSARDMRLTDVHGHVVKEILG